MRDEGGGALLPLLAVALLAFALGAVVVDFATYLGARAQAQVAADAAALAAAPVTFRAFGASGDPKREAARFAMANNARLIRCECAVDRSWSPRTVQVVVAVEFDLLIQSALVVQALSFAEFRPVDIGR